MRRVLTLLMVLMLALGGGGMALAQDDGPSPDSPTGDRDDSSSDEGEDDEDEGTPEADGPDADAPVGRDDAASEDDETTDEPAGDEQDDAPADDAPLPEAPEGPLDLAAMTLDSNELPDGYRLNTESYVDLDALAEGLAEVVTPAQLGALGIVGYYETTYLSADGTSRIRSYAIEYPDVNAAEDGFALLEDEDRLVPDATDLEDAPGLDGVGEEPSEITTGTLEAGDQELATVDVTFRIDRLGIGVAVETFDGSEPDQDLAEELAEAKEARVVAALTGEEIANVDLALPERAVTFTEPTTFEGYQTVLDTYFVEESVAGDGLVGTYVRGTTFSEDPAETIAPYVTVYVSTYEDEEAVLAALDQTDEFVPQYERLEGQDVPPIGTAAGVGYEFASPIGTGDVDSFRLFAAVDDTLVSVDAQGFASDDDAFDAALAVAGVAVDCADGGDCGPVGLPEPSTGDDAGTPVASPASDDEDA